MGKILLLLSMIGLIILIVIVNVEKSLAIKTKTILITIFSIVLLYVLIRDNPRLK